MSGSVAPEKCQPVPIECPDGEEILADNFLVWNDEKNMCIFNQNFDELYFDRCQEYKCYYHSYGLILLISRFLEPFAWQEGIQKINSSNLKSYRGWADGCSAAFMTESYNSYFRLWSL